MPRDQGGNEAGTQRSCPRLWVQSSQWQSYSIRVGSHHRMHKEIVCAPSRVLLGLQNERSRVIQRRPVCMWSQTDFQRQVLHIFSQLQNLQRKKNSEGKRAMIRMIRVGSESEDERRKATRCQWGRVGLIIAQYTYVWNITAKPITWNLIGFRQTIPVNDNLKCFLYKHYVCDFFGFQLY